MSGRRVLSVTAKPVRISVHPERGYELLVKIIGGPNGMLDRTVTVQLSAEVLNKIAEWEPSQAFERLDLQQLEPARPVQLGG